MARLSCAAAHIKDHYEVVVVGSGYGGSIAASRLARAGRSVCLLERGREFQPGEFPDTLLEAAREFQTDLPSGHVGLRTGLFDMRVNDDISVFQGCGLGGTSLINANVSLRADRRVFQDPVWPTAVRSDPAVLDDGYRLAEEMLAPTPYPDHFPALAKLDAHLKSAGVLNAPVRRAPINVTFTAGLNRAGVQQEPCNLCGDCVTGCNHRAKNTTSMNYLPDARRHGADILTGLSVRYVERRGGRWLVHYQILESGRESFNADTLVVSADVVVLAGGSLGSTEILLRSRAHGLPLSSQIGERFTGNGDVLAFAYNCDQPLNGIGRGELTLSDANVGPCITAVIDLRDQPNVDDGMVIEEGSIPGAIRGFLTGAMAAAAAAIGRDTDSGIRDAWHEGTRELAGLVGGAYTGAVHNTQTFLVMAHDGSGGRMTLEHDRLRIHWPGVGDAPIFEQVAQKLEKAASALGGTYVRNPLWSGLTNHALVTVHPLGGCGMADRAEQGVVNHKGQVFAGPSGTEAYEGLYVFDGAIMPRSLGVNPLLTISAFAERNAALLARDRGWTIDYAERASPGAAPPDPKPGIQFTETMKGFFTPDANDFQQAWDLGRQANSPFSFLLTVSTDDAEAMLTDPQHKGRMVGTVEAPALSPTPLTATEGVFRLFVVNPAQPGVRNMVYSMTLTSDEGARYRFSGYKVVRDDRGLDLWSDTTTMFVVVYRREGDAEHEVGKGLLRIRPADFLKQMNSFRAINCPSITQRLSVIARFGRFFGGALYDVYGSVFARPTAFGPETRPRKKRTLLLPAPEVVFVEAADGAHLCLTRYQAGRKGPVVLVPGAGTSSLVFVLDTLAVTPAEFLCAHGYDVWLLDPRSSPAVRHTPLACSLDEVAKYDIPAAIRKVIEITGAPDVQVVAHCLGAAAFQMSVLGGYLASGVRSAVLSQFGAYVGAGPAARHFPPQGPAAACDGEACGRIRHVWGEAFDHGQLDPLTHEALRGLFGLADEQIVDHLARIFESGRLVDKAGGDVYLPHVDRLNLPITFIQGERNGVLAPAGSARTFAALCERNGPALYRHRVFAGYGHLDCLVGKDAARDVYPVVAAELDRYNALPR
ncbi:MAG TPA: GMC family oxidoreductase N-terminal domain-containing protein [Vicinamibacterales bacterium]|nr:GMC family oxidoreductase N-terminal domain-containing protein [Vicinamibacterales bacterium]